MNRKDIVRALNLTEGEVITLEKNADRMEFEALPLAGMLFDACGGAGSNCACNGSNCNCNGSNCAIDIQFRAPAGG